MYRSLTVLFYLLFATIGHAAIYKWADENGNTSYGQAPPRNIISQEITIKSAPVETTGKPQKSIQDSADEIAKSNAERKASTDKTTQKAQQQRLLQDQCANAKKELSTLGIGGNRLYKDSDGNYSRINEDDKNQQRQKLSAFIHENCR